MSCNPCCCWKLKDAAVSIGIWSGIFSFIELGIFGWQMNAIKYEKDRAANTLLPNYNTYGRYDIPAYYESYWQSPEERYYTGLFIVQILCLISAFFLLFASVIMIYGVHTWSRTLLWPWLITMLCMILTTLAYCITWWAGDVRDYWLVLTILQFFGVVVNCYCFVVIWVFYKNMADELRYYEVRRSKKYKRGSPQTTELDISDEDARPGAGGGVTPYPTNQFQNWDDPRWTEFDPNIKYAPAPEPMTYRGPPYAGGKMPAERFDSGLPPDEPIFDDGFGAGRLQPAQSMPTLFDDFRDVPRQSQRRSSRRRRCSHCDHHRCSHHHTHNHHTHNHHRHSSHSRRHSSRRRKLDSCSSTCSTDLTATEDTISTHPQARRRHRSHHHYDDGPTQQPPRRSESRGKRKSRLFEDDSHPTIDLNFDRFRQKETRSIQVDPDELTPPPSQAFPPTSGGISIPQHIVIPPETDTDPATSGQPRKYQINSEITISYDPRTQQITGTPPLRPDSRQQFGTLGSGSSAGARPPPNVSVL